MEHPGCVGSARDPAGTPQGPRRQPGREERVARVYTCQAEAVPVLVARRKREDTRAARIAAIVQAVSMRITPLQAYEEMRLKRAASAARASCRSTTAAIGMPVVSIWTASAAMVSGDAARVVSDLSRA